MTRSPDELRRAAEAWIAGDPDAATRLELGQLLEAGAFAELDERLTPLSFGTAGLRGAVGAGSGRMNLAVVLRTAYAIARHVLERQSAPGPVVIGYDARPTSRGFAEASAEVLLAAGLEVVAFPEPCPTPLACFVGRELGAAMTIVVTASHNPRPDNGYKVYGPDAVQIVPPADAEIASHIAQAPAANSIARLEASFAAAPPPGLALVTPAQFSAYFSALAAALPPGGAGRDVRIVHSALHGVGSAPMLRALSEAGFERVSVVQEQAAPDGSFPTTPFPNPEEPGTMKLALAEGERVGAELVLVNDPDADRVAAAARLDGELTVLDGNQVGALLADYCLRRASIEPAPLVLSSVVSSPLTALLARARGGRFERTHTGFKWLWTAALALERAGGGRFCYAYEEALGYSVFAAVRDKDGIAAGRALAELCAELAADGRTPFDRLFELYREHGLWASAARNISVRGGDAGERIVRSLDALASAGALELGDERVVSVLDYRRSDSASARPVWLGVAALVELELSGGARLLVRPSGTEPKLKLYGHVRSSVGQREQLATALSSARTRAAELLQALEAALRL